MMQNLTKTITTTNEDDKKIQKNIKKTLSIFMYV